MDYECYDDLEAEECSYGYYGNEEDFEKIGKFLTIDEISHLMDIRLHVKYDQKDRELEFDEQTGLYYTTTLFTHCGDTLINHILVEKCMQDRDKIDWQRTTNNYDFEIVDFIRRNYLHPLAWDMPREASDKICLGLIAKERYRESRIYNIREFWAKLYNDGLLWFADNLPSIQDAAAPFRYHDIPDDFIAWDRLFSTEYEAYSFYVDIKIPNEKNGLFSIQTFKKNIDFIALNRGGAKAAEIVRLLRDDWRDIVLFKYFHIQRLSPEEIEKFRLCLFEGMDRSLRIWDAETPKEEKPKQEPVNNEDFFCRITKHAIDSGHAQEVEDALRSAAVSAPKLVKAIKTNEALGYLDTQNLSSTELYDLLNEHYHLPFKVRVFQNYRSK